MPTCAPHLSWESAEPRNPHMGLQGWNICLFQHGGSQKQMLANGAQGVAGVPVPAVRGCGSCAPGVGGIALIFEGAGVRWPSGWGRVWDPLPRSLRLHSRGLGVDLWEVEDLRLPRRAQLAVPLSAHSGRPEALQGLTAATHGWRRAAEALGDSFWA